MTLKMKRGTIRVLDGKGSPARLETEAMVTGPRGLAIHREVNELGVAKSAAEVAGRRSASPWVVTHILSGAKIYALRTKAQARALVEALLPMDWEFKDPKDPKVAAMAPDVLAAIGAVKEAA